MGVARAVASFEFVKGEDAQIDWVIQVSDTDPTAKDITGWGLDVVVKRSAAPSGSTVVPSTSAVVTGPTGRARTSFASADTVALDGDYEFDLWRTDSGSKTCLASGVISWIDTVRN